VDPLCFGQLSVWRALESLPRRQWATTNITRAVLLKDVASTEDVREARAQCCARHESLRTTYEVTDPARPRQIVHAASAPRMDVIDLPDVDPPRLQRLADARADEPFLLDKDVGWNATLARVRGRPAALLVTMNHIVADGWALGRVLDEVTTLVAGDTMAQPDQSTEPTPRALAAAQRSTAWEARRGAAIEYWARLLRTAPLTDPPPADSDRVHCHLPLGAVSGAVTSIAKRERVFPQAVALALTATTIARLTRARAFLLWSMVSNRFDPRWRATVTSMNQAIPVHVEIGSDEPFASLLSRLQLASTEAMQHGCYDVDAVRRLALRIAGRPAEIGYLINYTASGWPPPAAETDLARGVAPRPTTTASRKPATVPFYVIVSGHAELTLSVHAPRSLGCAQFVDHFRSALIAAAGSRDLRVDGSQAPFKR